MAMGRLWATLAVLATAANVPAPQPEGPQPQGLWLGPHHNVAVRTGPCGDRLCGWIVWADGEAQADARDGGTPRLVGTELLEDYRAEGRGQWRGTVFVPDMGRRFASQISQLSPGRLRVKGCILGGLICKSQLWTRIERLPGQS
ncbi:Protein of unknown function DUF2147 [Sphingobium chlorophenolicum L-1]|uniref:DUF2147 domain-containing protein n=1 Tax=Sphingobium chlorophenolicum L-1 TaxID=690566 RepID=F6EYT8_SPHCR|nr:DUF2147 domain-containing protein [Sphingobium chlorophenolicum]AEG50138.1 Protein of unknown function DUF2147 [Sphingobium chlorophenolicum L-1]